LPSCDRGKHEGAGILSQRTDAGRLARTYRAVMDRAKGADSCARGAIPRSSKSRARARKGAAHYSKSGLFTSSCFCRQICPPPMRRAFACIGTNTLKHHAVQLRTKARRAFFKKRHCSTSQRAHRRRDAACYASPPARDAHGDKRHAQTPLSPPKPNPYPHSPHTLCTFQDAGV